ncbi:MAG: ornithine cyclodeaminase family protein [Desulfatirhabdiaceae bacterium]
MNIRILTADDVKAALPIEKAIDVMAQAFSQLSSDQATVPLRTHLNTDKGVTLLMPAFLHQSRQMAIKLVSIYTGNDKLGLPTVPGLVMVFDPETGMPVAMMEGHSLTAIRTGATGGLAAKILSRPDSQKIGLFGAGTQGLAQTRAVLAVRAIRQIHIYDQNLQYAENLAARIRELPDAPEVFLAPTPKAAVQNADIIITATTSSIPVFDGADVMPGTHITAVGSFRPTMQEVDETTVRKARVVVDSRKACLAEAGDLIISGATIHAEIGEIINKTNTGRESADQITFFKTVGVAVQDAAAAAVVLAEAETLGLGKMITL